MSTRPVNVHDHRLTTGDPSRRRSGEAVRPLGDRFRCLFLEGLWRLHIWGDRSLTGTFTLNDSILYVSGSVSGSAYSWPW